MLLYLIRHAHALDGGKDAARPLSKRGRAQVRALARALRGRKHFQPAAVWHSPLVRARQTAERLVERAGLTLPLRTVSGLTPEDPPQIIARRLNRLRRDVAIVGHEPHLSALATLLVTGEAEPPVFVLKKCAALELERYGTRWVVRWLGSPESSE